MTLGERFTDAVSEAYGHRPGRLELLPEMIAQACVAVLGVSAAGICMLMDDLRVPLGSSDEEAASAEQLQITLGQGPCLDAISTATPQVFGPAALAARWPLFHGQVVAQTPFRAIASLPIQPREVAAVGALDLYSTQGDGLEALAWDEIAATIPGRIASYLFDAPSAALKHGITLPLWLGNEAVSNRLDVWIAVGALMELAQLSKEGALAAMRAYAARHQTTLDDVAHQIADEALLPQLVLG